MGKVLIKAAELVIFSAMMFPVYVVACIIARLVVPQADLPVALLAQLGIH